MIKNIKKRIYEFRKAKSNLNMIITVFAIVMIWRGIWGILDSVLFPNHPIISYVFSMILGVVILLLDNQKLDELSHH